MSNPEISEKDSPTFCAALCIIWQGQPLKYTAGFCSSTLALMESRMPMLTEVLSTPAGTAEAIYNTMNVRLGSLLNCPNPWMLCTLVLQI